MKPALDFWLEETAGTVALNRGTLGASANGTVSASADLNVSGQIGSGIQCVADVANYDAVAIPDLPALDLDGFVDDETFMCWVYSDTLLAVDNSVIFGRGFLESIYWRQGKLRMRMGGIQVDTGTITASTWTHICAVCQQNGANREAVLHRDGGAAAGGITATVTMIASSAPTDPWRIRGVKTESDTLTLDEAKLYTSALTADEVKAIYESELAGKRLGVGGETRRPLGLGLGTGLRNVRRG